MKGVDAVPTLSKVSNKSSGGFCMVESMGILHKPLMAGCLIVSSCWMAGCGGTLGADPAEDSRLWQGTWRMVSCTWNGQPQPGDVLWIVQGEHYNIRLDRQTHADPYPFQLDPSQKHIDVNHHETPKGTYGGKLKGIYETNGNSLRVCYDLTGARYPKSFEAGPGSP
jgi:uncharacterized protein (TIGR03067 family)